MAVIEAAVVLSLFSCKLYSVVLDIALMFMDVSEPAVVLSLFGCKLYSVIDTN